MMTEEQKRVRNKGLEDAALAVEALFMEMQEYALSDAYVAGFSDAIAKAASVIRLTKLNVPPPWLPPFTSDNDRRGLE